MRLKASFVVLLTTTVLCWLVAAVDAHQHLLHKEKLLRRASKKAPASDWTPPSNSIEFSPKAEIYSTAKGKGSGPGKLSSALTDLAPAPVVGAIAPTPVVGAVAPTPVVTAAATAEPLPANTTEDAPVKVAPKKAITIVNNKNFLAMPHPHMASEASEELPANETDAIPVDCEWSDWTDSSCSVSCGSGKVVRQRIVSRREENGGARCDGLSSQETPCNHGPCPVVVNCLWSDFSEWSACSASCEGGKQTRSRYRKLDAQNGGKPCAGGSLEERSCNLDTCGENCEWDEWMDWGPCSASCGGGVQQRARSKKTLEKNGGLPCAGNGREERDCNTYGCPTDCLWSEWDAWPECSKSCGGGTTTRNRIKAVLASDGGRECHGPESETKDCGQQPCPVDCQWQPWSEFSTCSASCGSGTQQRFRTNTPPSSGGAVCTGPSQESRVCTLTKCPVDCQWAAWGGWGICTQTCAGGTQTRSRSVLQEPSGAGTQCQGGSSEQRACNTESCPCSWETWTDWTACTKTCDGGKQQRFREMKGSTNCDGRERGERDCGTEPCPCDWTAWSGWSACSETCGAGKQQRLRAQTGGVLCTRGDRQVQECNTEICPPPVGSDCAQAATADGQQVVINPTGAPFKAHCKLFNNQEMFTLVAHENAFPNTPTAVGVLRSLAVATGDAKALLEGGNANIGPTFFSNAKNFLLLWTDSTTREQFWVRFSTTERSLFANPEWTGDMLLTQLSTNHDSFKASITRGAGATFCRAYSPSPGKQPGDSSWAVVPRLDAFRQCGCNSGGWAGRGLYYGGSNPPSVCNGHGGGFSGFTDIGGPKGNVAKFDLKIYARK